MTAREYLEKIRLINFEQRRLYKEILTLENSLYNCKGVNYERNHVTGGNISDLSSKVLLIEKTLHKRREEYQFLLDLQDEARKRINAVTNKLFVNILLSYYINSCTLLELKRMLNYEKSSIYQRKKQAIQAFERANSRFLGSIKDIY